MLSFQEEELGKADGRYRVAKEKSLGRHKPRWTAGMTPLKLFLNVGASFSPA
jgi:hypothetical protein